MNSKLSVKEREKLSTAAALAIPGMKEKPEEAKPVMTRKEKLMRWAAIVRSFEGYILSLYHRLEHYDSAAYHRMVHPGTAFALAYRDPVLSEAGLKDASVGASMDFFELSREELHEFSCDCGGSITNQNMADRIEKIATASPRRTHNLARSLLGRFAG